MTDAADVIAIDRTPMATTTTAVRWDSQPVEPVEPVAAHSCLLPTSTSTSTTTSSSSSTTSVSRIKRTPSAGLNVISSNIGNARTCHGHDGPTTRCRPFALQQGNVQERFQLCKMLGRSFRLSDGFDYRFFCCWRLFDNPLWYWGFLNCDGLFSHSFIDDRH